MFSRFIRLSLVALTALTLGACAAGQNFARPGPADLQLGKSTFVELTTRLGSQPQQQGTSQKNGEDVTSVSYAYAHGGQAPLVQSVTPSRGINLHFHKGILVGHEFLSSFAADPSDFDETKVSQIQKGKTTRAEVEAIMGKPTGEYIFPMIKDPTGSGLFYGYTHVKGSAFNMKFHRKVLIVTLDKAGVVSDVDLNVVGER